MDNDVYQETKDIVWGKRKKSPLLEELSDWFRLKYAVKVLNIQFSKLKGLKENRFRLYVIIENTQDYHKMYVSPYQPNPEYQEQVALEFRKLALKYGFTDESNLENLFVIYNDFSDEARVAANWKAEEEVKTQVKSKKLF